MGSDVAVTVETEPQPPHVLLLRGRVSITEVDGMVPEQAQAARRFPGEKGGAGYLAQAEHQDGPYHAASHVGGRPGLPDAASGRHEGRTVSRSSSSPTAAPATSRTASPLRRAVPGRIVDNDSGDETVTLAGSRPPTRGWSRPDATQASPTAATRARRGPSPPARVRQPGRGAHARQASRRCSTARVDPRAGIVGGRCVAPDGSAAPRSWWGRRGLRQRSASPSCVRFWRGRRLRILK